MSEKLKRIEFKSSNYLSLEEAAKISGFLITRTSIYRESERSRLYDEVVGQGVSYPFARHEAAGRNIIDDIDEVTAHQEFSTHIRWLDEKIWKSYYEIMGMMTPRNDRLSMTSLNIGLLGVEPVFLEQHWHTDDLDDPGRDYTEFQYVVADPKTVANPPLAEEIKTHLSFVTEGSPVSDKEIPGIQTFGTIDQGQLRDLLPA